MILAGEITADFVYRDDEVAVFLDHRPLQLGHCLVVPRTHHQEILDTPDGDLSGLALISKRVAAAQRSALGCAGNFVASNAVISQSVPHIHIHVVPRDRGDGMKGFFWPRTRYGSAQDAARYAQLLASAMAI